MYYLELYLKTWLEPIVGENVILSDHNYKIIEQRLARDYTNVRKIFEYNSFGANVDSIQYQGRYIFLIVFSKHTPFKNEDVIEAKNEIVLGPDTWMQGDITIYSKNGEEWELYVDILGVGRHYYDN